MTASATSRTTPSQIRLPAWTNDPAQLEPGRKWCTFWPCTTLMPPATMNPTPPMVATARAHGTAGPASRSPPRRARPRRGHRAATPAGQDPDEQRPRVVEPAPLALVLGGVRRAGPGRPGRRAVPDRTGASGRPAAQAARQLPAHPASGAGREEAQQQAQGQGGPGHRERGPDHPLGRPRQLDREARATELLQLRALTCHPLAKPSTSWGGPRSTAVRAGGGSGAGLGPGLPALVMLCPRTSSKDCEAPETAAP